MFNEDNMTQKKIDFLIQRLINQIENLPESVKETLFELDKEIAFNKVDMLEHLVENSAIGLVLGKPDGTILKANSKAAELFGYSVEEFMRLHREAIFNTTTSEYKSALDKRKKDGVLDAEFLGVRKDGSTFPVAVTSKMVSDSKGNLFTSTSLIDITEIKKQELEIKALNQLLGESQRIANLGAWSFDFRNNKLLWTDQLYHVFGADKATFHDTHESFIDFVDDEFQDRVRETSKKAQETGEAFTIVYRITTPSGERRWIEEHGFAEKNKQGDVVRLYGTAQNITDRFKLESELKSSLKHIQDYRTALHAVSAVSVTNRDGLITFANERFCEITGYDLEELIGQNHRIIKSGIHEAEVYETMWKTILEGKIWRGQIQNKRKDGSYFWADSTIVPFLNEHGEPYQFMAIRFDITKQKETELALEHRNEFIETTLNNLPVGVVIRLLNQPKYIYVNTAFTTTYGWTINDFSTATVDEHLHFANPEFLENVTSQVRKRIELNDYSTLFFSNIALHNKNGNLHIVDLFIIPLKSQESYVITLLDKTDERTYLNHLQESNERYEYINKATQDALYERNFDSDELHFSENYQVLFRHSPNGKRCILQGWQDLIHPEDKTEIIQTLEEAYADPEINRWNGEYRYRRGDGTYAYVTDTAYILRNEQGKAVRIIGAMRDISSKKIRDEQLKLFETVITKANNGVLITNMPTGKHSPPIIIYVNEGFTKITGYEPKDIIGKSPAILYGDKSDPEVFQSITEAIANRETWQGVVLNYRKDGSTFYNDVSLTPIQNEKGEFTHWISINKDVSERYIYMTAIEEKNRQLEEISWIQSHVIRAPLARLMGLISNKDLLLGEKLTLQELMETMSDSAQEIDMLIREITIKTEALEDLSNEG